MIARAWFLRLLGAAAVLPTVPALPSPVETPIIGQTARLITIDDNLLVTDTTAEIVGGVRLFYRDIGTTEWIPFEEVRQGPYHDGDLMDHLQSP